MPLGSPFAAPTATLPPPEEEYVAPPPEYVEPAPAPETVGYVNGEPVQSAAPVEAAPPPAEAGPPQPVQVAAEESPAPTQSDDFTTLEEAAAEEAPPPETVGYVNGEPVSSGQAAPDPESQEVPTLEQAGAALKDTLVNADVGQRVQEEGISAIPAAAGEMKDAVVEAIPAMGGDILPWRRHHTDAIVRGQLEEGAPEDPNVLDQTVRPFEQYIHEDPERAQRLMEEGYTDPATGNTYTGEAAVWESFVSDKPVWQRALLDIRYDPSMATILLAPLRAPTLAGRAIPKAVGTGARLADDVVSLGVGPAIEGTLGVGKAALKKTGLLAPTQTQAATTATEEATETAGALVNARRASGAVSDMTSTEVSPGVYTLEHPTGLVPPVTVQTQGKQVVGILDDPSNLGNVRVPTAEEYEQLTHLASRVNPETHPELVDALSQVVRQPNPTASGAYLQTIRQAFSSPPGSPARAAAPLPTNVPDLLALRSAIRTAATKDPAMAGELVQLANRSQLLPTPATTPQEAINAIGLLASRNPGPPSISPQTLTAVQGTLRRELDRRGLGDVALSMDRVITELGSGRPLPTVEGQYFNGVITLATDLANAADEATLTARLGDVMNHETVHALRHYNLFRKNEWTALSEYATRTGAAGDNASFLQEVTSRYEAAAANGQIPAVPGPDALVEEAVAEMFRSYVRGELVPTPVQRSLLEKIAAFFSTLVGVLRPRPATVLGNIERGTVGARPRTGTQQMATPRSAMRAFRENMSERPVITTALQPDPRVGPNGRPWAEYPDNLPGRGWALHSADPGLANEVLGDLTQDLLAKYPKVKALVDGQPIKGGKVVRQNFEGFFAKDGQALFAQQISDAARMRSRDRLWYEKTVAAVEEHFALPPEVNSRLFNVLAVTSGRAKPAINLGRTVSIISNWLRGVDDYTPTGGATQQVRRALTGGEQVGTDKFGNFARTFNYLAGYSDDPPKATIDLQMAKVFGMVDNKPLAAGDGQGEELYDFMHDYLEGVRDLLNAEAIPRGDLPWQTWQVQAALWSNYRQGAGVQQIGAYDDVGTHVEQMAEQLQAAGITDRFGQITADTMRDPRISARYGQTAEWWRQAPWFTLESRSFVTPEGAAAGDTYERLFAIPLDQIEDPAIRGSVNQGIQGFREIERSALNDENFTPNFNKIMRGITGRGGLRVTKLTSNAYGTYEGHIGVNARIPLQAAEGGTVGGKRVRAEYTDDEIRQTLALTSLAYDQRAAAASRFDTVNVGDNNAWSIRIPTATQIEGDASIEQALSRLEQALGWPASIKYDTSGIVFDVHVLDPSQLPDPATMMRAYAEAAEHAFPGVDAQLIPRARSDYYMEAPEYRAPIRQLVEGKYVRPLLAPMEAHVGALRAKPKTDPAKLAASEEALLRIKRARNLLYTEDVTADSVGLALREIKDALTTYHTRGGGTLPGGRTVLKRVSDLEGGWSGLRANAARRDEKFAAWNNAATQIANHAEYHTIYGRETGAPRDTQLGPAYSVVRAKGYHGSPRFDISFIAADLPEGRHAGYGARELGAFFSGDYTEAMLYAGRMGELYESDIVLEKPYHTTLSFIHGTYGYASYTAQNAAKDFRSELEKQGHDGIIAWGKAVPEMDADGNIIGDYNVEDMQEIITFKNQSARPAVEPYEQGPPRKTAAGPAYSVVKQKMYHGSPKMDLTVLSPNPPEHKFAAPVTKLGAFVTPSRSYGEGYAHTPGMSIGKGGKLYETDVTLNKPYYMEWRDFRPLTGPDDPEKVEIVKNLRADLEAEGYDGILITGYPRMVTDLPAGEFREKKIVEVVLFNEAQLKPYYSVSKGQSGVPPVRPGVPAAAGTYKRGSSEEYLGTMLPDADREILDREYSFGGRTEKVWQTAVRHQDSIERARSIAQKQAAGAQLTAREQSELDTALKGLQQFTELKGLTSAQLAGWSDEAVDSLAAKRTARFIDQAQGLRDASGETVNPGYYKGLAGKALKAYDNFAAYRRTMSLYSTTRGPAYVLMQAIGNGITLGIARPSALRYYSPIEAKNIARRGKTNYVPYVDRLRSGVGLGRTDALGGSRDQLGFGGQPNQTFFERSTNPVVRGIGKVVANPAIKEYADANDINLRHAVYRSAFEPGYARIRQDLIGNAGRSLQEAAARAGLPAPVRGADLAQAIRDLGPRFTGEQLRAALTDPARLGPAAASPVVRGAAERLARDYINDVRTLDKFAIANVNRIGFDFAETRIDAILSRGFMFHYWLSRASVLYLTEAARNPYQLQLWSRAMSAGNRKAEAGWPEWQKDMMEFMRTPAGITGLFNPAYLVGTYLFFQEGGEPLPFADLTKVGEAIEGTFLKNVMLNPLLHGAIYVLGAGGTDFRPPDFFGTGKWTNDINTWLEKANRDVATFYATEKGTPKVVPNLDSKQLLSWVAEQITQRGWQNDFFGMAPISGYDPNRSEQADLAYLIQDQVLAAHPELNDGTQENAELLASMVEEALGNPDSDLYQAAAENLVSLQTSGPGSGRGNAALDIAGYYGRMVLPFGVTSQVTSRRERTIRANREKSGLSETHAPLDTEMGYIDDATPTKQQFDLGYDAVRGAWSPAATAIRDTYSGIKKGLTPTGAINIDGRTWSDADLATLPQADRDTLAQYWMLTKHPDLGNRTGWEIQEEAYAAEKAILDENPMVAEYRTFDDYIAAYPDGPLAAIEDTAAINANYRRFLETLPSDLTEAEFVDEATSVSGFAALKGEQFSRYDATPMEAGKGAIAGLAEGETLTDWKAAQDSAEGSLSFDEQADLEFANYQEAIAILNKQDPSGGLAATYTEELKGYTFNGRQVDDTIYGILSGEGMSDEAIAPPNDKEQGYNKISFYLKWTAENGVTPGEQWEEYRYQDSKRYLGEKVADINSGIYSDPDPATDAPDATPQSLVSDENIYARPEKQDPWWQAAGNFLGETATKIGNFIGGRNGEATETPPTKPGMTSTPFTRITTAPDGMGLKSTPDSDRTWMEEMVGPNHAAVSVDFKQKVTWDVDYSYQNGHGADHTTHAAYDITCDLPDGNCEGMPINSPITGKVLCAGYGSGTGESMAGCTYSQKTTAPGSAHTVVLDAGVDVDGNPIQLSFSHMGTSAVTPGQTVNPGDPLGGMGNTDAGPHIHLEAWGYSPELGTYRLLDPQLVVAGYYETHGVDSTDTQTITGKTAAPAPAPSGGIGYQTEPVSTAVAPERTDALPVAGGDWEVLDQFNDSYITAADQVYQETGLYPPPDLLKAKNAMESGFGRVNEPYEGIRDDLRNKRLVGFVGVFEDAADSWGVDFERMAEDPNYAIYGMAKGLATIAEWDASQYDPSATGTVYDNYGWDGVMAIYYSGQPFLDAPQPADDATTVRQYVENINAMRQQIV